MSNVVASARLDNFDIADTLIEQNLDKDYYLRLNFEGAVSRTQPLKNAKIYYVQYGSGTSPYFNQLNRHCDNVIKYVAYNTDSNTQNSNINNISVNDVKKYDLVLFDAHVWNASGCMSKANELIEAGIPVYIVGNDTNDTRYAFDTVAIGSDDDTDIAGIIDQDYLPFRYDNTNIQLCRDSRNGYRQLGDNTFPLVTCKGINIVFYHISNSGAVIIQDNSSNLSGDFFIAMIKYLLTTKVHTQCNDIMLHDDGYVMQPTYVNLWDKNNTGGTYNNFVKMDYFDGGVSLPPEVKDSDIFWKVSPHQGMNYYISNSDDAKYPSGTTYRISAWVYVDKNCDMAKKSVRICGEQMTSCTANYDFNKLGTWQFLTTTVTSNRNGFYFLLYANAGASDDTACSWTKGCAYFTHVTMTADSMEHRYQELPSSAYGCSVNNISITGDFSIIYRFKQIIDYHKQGIQKVTKNIVNFTTNGKEFSWNCWYMPQGANILMGFDQFITSGLWHIDLGYESGKYKGDDLIIIMAKKGSSCNFYTINGEEIYSASNINLSNHNDLVNMNIDRIWLSNDFSSICKDFIVYDRDLSKDEIVRLFTKPKHLKINTTGDLITPKFSEKLHLSTKHPLAYLDLSESSCNSKLTFRNCDTIIQTKDGTFVGDVINDIPEGCVFDPNPSNIGLVVDYDQSENMYTIHYTKDMTQSWRGITMKINKNIIVQKNKTYILEFEVYSEIDTQIYVDLNTTGIETATSSNDNHTSSSGNNKTINKNKWYKMQVQFTMGAGSNTYKCGHNICILNTVVIPYNIKLKIRNIKQFELRENINEPYVSNSMTSKIQFNLYEDIGFKWNDNWSLLYFKKPIYPHNHNMSDYHIDSIGCNNNSVGDKYIWFGKDANSTNRFSISGFSMNGSVSTTANVDTDSLYNNWQIVTLRYDKSNSKIKYYVYQSSGKTIKLEKSITAISKDNAMVTQYGYDLFLGGWDNSSLCGAFYKDLLVYQEFLSDDVIDKICKTWITDYENNTVSISSLREGGI